MQTLSVSVTTRIVCGTVNFQMSNIFLNHLQQVQTRAGNSTRTPVHHTYSSDEPTTADLILVSTVSVPLHIVFIALEIKYNGFDFHFFRCIRDVKLIF